MYDDAFCFWHSPDHADDAFCFWHSPDHADDAAQARKLGGLRRKR